MESPGASETLADAAVIEKDHVSEAEEPKAAAGSMPESPSAEVLEMPASTEDPASDAGPLSDEALERLVSGVMSHLAPEFKKARNTLEDLVQNQRILIETVTAENAKFDECAAMKEVVDVMDKAKVYHTKLLHIKKDMAMLHDKSAKLKKRSLKLQQQKQKEALEREANREREMEKERMLIAQPASGAGKVL